MRLVCRGESVEVRLNREAASLGGRNIAFGQRRVDGNLVALEIGERVISVRAIREAGGVRVWCEGRAFEVQKGSGRNARPRETGSLISPMPGRVRSVEVAAGDRVERGQVVVILEAMKMEHAIRSPREGVVAGVAFKEGDLVDAGVELVEIR